jgi:integrase
MAYLRSKKGKRGTTWEVLVYVSPQSRPNIRLGRVNARIAQTAKARIESLVAAKIAGHSLDAETAGWVAGLHDVIYERLFRAGLVERRVQVAPPPAPVVLLADQVDRYINSRAALKPNTVRNYKTTKRLLVEHFGGDQPIRMINSGHAKDYREWLLKKYARATVAREVKRARQFFEYAKDCGSIETNPFIKVKAGSQKNTKRKAFVGGQVVAKVLESLPDNLWRLALVLTRYGGLRIPSEISRLTWADIDWAGRCFTLHVPKKEHIDGHETRVVPIFPEVEPYLRQAFDEAPAGSLHVLPTRFHNEGYVYAGVKRAVKLVGVEKWPKLLQNLRASRETELMLQYPAHIVHAWLGNSKEVAEDHYLMVTPEDIMRAASMPSSIPTPNPTPSTLVLAHQESPPENEEAVSPAFANDTASGVPPRGVEPRFSD